MSQHPRLARTEPASAPSRAAHANGAVVGAREQPPVGHAQSAHCVRMARECFHLCQRLHIPHLREKRWVRPGRSLGLIRVPDAVGTRLAWTIKLSDL
jgi:hypothetical protein